MANDFPMRIRVSRQESALLVKALIEHPMDSGIARDAQGRVPPAHFITVLTVLVNGQLKVRGALGPGISRNPLFTWRLAGGAAGDEVVVAWEDNLGYSGKQSATVS